MAKILIVDDDEMICKAAATLASRMGHEVKYALTLEGGLDEAGSSAFDVVFLDVLMPDGNGLDVLSRFRETPSEPEIIIMTASGDPDGAELAIRSGAWDYIEKSASIKDMMLPLGRALQYRKEKLRKAPAVLLKRERIIGSSHKMRASLNLLAQAAASNANVLIAGETGTGKELFARAIHFNRPRGLEDPYAPEGNPKRSFKEGDFVVLDCTALPETLVESVLFGHEKGAFTGADRAREGLIKQADGGTLFLDEVGELPLHVQKAFLRVLHEHRFRPVGGKSEIESEFRIIAATHRNLEEMAEKGEFRKDLLYRLRSLTIDLPPLRERTEDIRELCRFHVARLCDQYQMPTKGFSPDFFDALESYDWPGNIRELINTLDGGLAIAGQEATLFAKHLPLHIRIRKVRSSLKKSVPPRSAASVLIGEDRELPKYSGS